MKKVYSKPEIMFEDFTLSVNIAGNCEKKTNTPSRMQCGVHFGADIIFIEGVSGCKEIVEDNNNNYGYCYHVPVDTNNLFNS